MVSVALIRKELFLPFDMIAPLLPFALLFSPTVFRHAQRLLVGAILAPKKRTVTAALCAASPAHDPHFNSDHRILNRAYWSYHKSNGLLFKLLVTAFTSVGFLLVGLDETLKRRTGEKIATKGVYRDAARSSKEYLTRAGGLRWIAMMLPGPIPFADRV